MSAALGRAQLSWRYIGHLLTTPADDDLAAPSLRWWKLPLCWVRGHSFEWGPSFCITDYQLAFCACCGEEVAGRTRWSQIALRPDDAPVDYCADPWGDL